MGTSELRRGLATAAGIVAAGSLVLSGSGSYLVRPGDTLSAIAAEHGVSVRAIAELNGIADPDRIFAGQELELPGSAGRDGVSASTHTVRRGENLTRIAKRYDVTVSALADANDLADANHVLAGQPLTIPSSRAGGAGSQEVQARPADTSQATAGDVIATVASRHGWNPAFVKALAWQESGWQMDKISSTGAVGVMQVQPGTGQFVSRHLVGRSLDLHDLEDNVTAGVAFLDYLWGLTDGDVERTLGGYYQGLRSISENGMYDDTKRYIANVLALKKRFE